MEFPHCVICFLVKSLIFTKVNGELKLAEYKQEFVYFSYIILIIKQLPCCKMQPFLFIFKFYHLKADNKGCVQKCISLL